MSGRHVRVAVGFNVRFEMSGCTDRTNTFEWAAGNRPAASAACARSPEAGSVPRNQIGFGGGVDRNRSGAGGPSAVIGIPTYLPEGEGQ